MVELYLVPNSESERVRAWSRAIAKYISHVDTRDETNSLEKAILHVVACNGFDYMKVLIEDENLDALEDFLF